jgi:hypothetical protein
MLPDKVIMKRKFKQGWSTIPPISIKRTKIFIIILFAMTQMLKRLYTL